MAQNLVLSEVEFAEFKRFCSVKGFDLSYFSPEISGSRKEIEHYQFDSPKVIKLERSRFSFRGTPYDVAEWQRETWRSSLLEIWSEFSKRRVKAMRVDSFQFGSIVIDGKKYGRDVLLFPEGTVRQREGGFWKFGSHSITKAEIEELIKAKPEVLIVGTGTAGRAKITPEAETCAQEANVKLLAAPSPQAIKHMNQLLGEGKRVSAIVHVTW